MSIECFIDTNLFLYQIENVDKRKSHIADLIIRKGIRKKHLHQLSNDTGVSECSSQESRCITESAGGQPLFRQRPETSLASQTTGNG